MPWSSESRTALPTRLGSEGITVSVCPEYTGTTRRPDGSWMPDPPAAVSEMPEPSAGQPIRAVTFVRSPKLSPMSPLRIIQRSRQPDSPWAQWGNPNPGRPCIREKARKICLVWAS